MSLLLSNFRYSHSHLLVAGTRRATCGACYYELALASTRTYNCALLPLTEMYWLAQSYVCLQVQQPNGIHFVSIVPGQ